MDKDDLWSGIRLVVSGLADAAKKASYSLGFGAGGLGITLFVVSRLEITAPASFLIAMSAFFILARLGKILDDRFERAALEARMEDYIKLDRKVRRHVLPEGFYHRSDMDYYLERSRDEQRKFEQMQKEQINYETERLRQDMNWQLEERLKSLIHEIKNQLKDKPPSS